MEGGHGGCGLCEGERGVTHVRGEGWKGEAGLGSLEEAPGEW